MIVMDSLHPDCPDGFILVSSLSEVGLVKPNEFYIPILEDFMWAI